jgi:hypothetical protein
MQHWYHVSFSLCVPACLLHVQQELSQRLAAEDQDIFEGLPALSAALGGLPGSSIVSVLLNSQHQAMPLQRVLAVAAGKQ